MAAAARAPREPVFAPDVGAGELRVEGGEPGGVEGDGAALEELPGACCAGAGLDGSVDVAGWDAVFEFVVEDGLEGGEDLGKGGVSWGRGVVVKVKVKVRGKDSSEVNGDRGD